MNNVDMKAIFADISAKNVPSVFKFIEHQSSSTGRDKISVDRYSSINAGETVAAKVLSFSIGQRFEDALPSKNIQGSLKVNKLNVNDGSSIFNIDKVVENVLGFVTSALTELAKNGAGSDDLIYFKQQAEYGVNLGVEQAKVELANVSDEKLSKSIDDSRTRILDGIDKLPNNPTDYLKSAMSNSNDALTLINVQTKTGKTIDISFGSMAFSSEVTEKSQKQFYTTQASNISFSVLGKINSNEGKAFADVVNRADDLAKTFYRKDISSEYDKAVGLGYSDAALRSLSMQVTVNDKKNVVSAYQDVQHLLDGFKLEELSPPKVVAQYLTRLMSVMDASERELSSNQDYNQIINGLVNQMKDVQVPDLLQAINRFHAFNAKFVSA